MYQKDKASASKVKFIQASNHCKRFLEAAKLAYSDKTKESVTSQELGSWDIWQIDKILNKNKSAIPPLFSGPELLSSSSDTPKLFAEKFSESSNLDDSGIFLPLLSSRTYLKLHHISLTPRMVKNFILNLGLSKVSGPDCIPVVVLKNCKR